MPPSSLRAALLVVLVLAAFPAVANASVTVTSTGSTVTVAGDNENDDVTVDYATIGTGEAAVDGLSVENTEGVVPVAPCVLQDATTVECPGDAITATLGDGNDRFNGGFDLFDVVADVRGQGGSDSLTGTVDGTYDGGDGDDTLRSLGFGDERYVGGGGTDTVTFGFGAYATIGPAADDDGGTRVDADIERILGGNGSDDFFVGPTAGTGHVISGGGGDDFLSYGQAGGPVVVTLDGVANDGTGGRTDNVDVESVSGSAGDDLLVGNDASNGLFGNSGRDRLVGDPGDGGGPDRLFGGTGDDLLEGRGGGDTLDGGDGGDRLLGAAGGDTLDGGPGADALEGGADSDLLSYDERSGGVTVTLGGGADDGVAGEGDDAAGDIERVTGSSGDDTLVGTDGDNDLRGGSGNDRLDGRGGRDAVSGDTGQDTVLGGAGPDDLRGGPGDDALDGGAGEDMLIGQDRDEGSQSNDVLELRDGERDSAACPAGISRVTADAFDLVSPSCVLVERTGAATPQPPAGTPALIAPPPLRIVKQRVRVDRRSYVRIKASCPPGPACSGVLQLVARSRKRDRTVARTVFAIPAARKRTIRLRLTPLGRRLLRSRRVLRVQIAIAADAPNSAVARGVALRLRR
jgi:Ca2+-binding RTX toxin-like protein